MQVPCTTCKQSLPGPVAGISTCPQGDEIIENYYFCAGCDHWTIESVRDVFITGEDIVKTYARARERGDAEVALIAQCPTPHNKLCSRKIHSDWH